MYPLEQLPLTERPEVLKRAVNQAELLLMERFPAAEGYRHKTHSNSPYKETPFVVEYEVKTQRGWLWGYSLKLTPTNCRHTHVKAWFNTSSALLDKAWDIAGYVFAAGAVATFFLCFIFMIIDGKRVSASGPLFAGVIVGGALYLLTALPLVLGSRWLMAYHRLPVDCELAQSLQHELQTSLTTELQGERSCS